MLTTRHPYTGSMIVDLCLRSSEREAAVVGKTLALVLLYFTCKINQKHGHTNKTMQIHDEVLDFD